MAVTITSLISVVANLMDAHARATALAAPSPTALAAPSQETLAQIQVVHEALLEVADVDIATEHLLHAGMYARTIRLDAGVAMVGSLIKLATILIVNGAVSILGDVRTDFDGYNVLPGRAGRKQLFVTRGPVEMTMLFATRAATVEEAENEVFAEAGSLMSRKDTMRDTTTITGE